MVERMLEWKKEKKKMNDFGDKRVKKEFDPHSIPTKKRKKRKPANTHSPQKKKWYKEIMMIIILMGRKRTKEIILKLR